MIVLIDVTGHLGIPNNVAVAIEDQEVGHPHDFNIRTCHGRVHLKGRLIDHGHSVRNGFQRFPNPHIESYTAQINVSAEFRQMLFFMLSSEPVQNLLKSAWFSFFFASVP